MDIIQVSRLLNDNNMPTISTATSLEEKREQGENFYKLRLGNNKWEFLLISEINDEKKILKNFSNEANASKYYYLFQLKRYFTKNYISVFEEDNKDIDIGEPNCEIGDLKKAFRRLYIDEAYFSLNKGIKEHSICLEQVNAGESKVKYIGENRIEIINAPKIENWLAYYNTYQKVYKLYLLDIHCKTLLDNQEIPRKFTDSDYKVVLS